MIDDLEFDPFSQAYFEDPYPIYRRLRSEAPVYRNERVNFSALSRYEEVFPAFRGWRTYISSKGVMLNQLNTPGFEGGDTSSAAQVG